MSTISDNERVVRSAGFPTRRLGHLNVYVSNIGASMDFYTRVCGIEEVFREDAIRAGFVSNGSRHHDVGMIQVSSDKKVGRGGAVLSTERREQEPGLNHLAFEVDTEREVVAGFEWLRTNGTDISMTVDHGLARSVYLRDPCGALIEFYADTLDDWRAFFDDALSRNELVTRRWEPGKEPPSDKVYFHANPEIRRVEQALLHPQCISHVTLLVPDLKAATAFYATAGGLEPIVETAELVALKGKHPGVHLVLVANEGASRPAIHHATFLLASDDDVTAGERRLRESGIPIAHRFTSERKSSLVIEDPDGMPVEFAHLRSDELPLLRGLAGEAQAWAI